MYCFLELEMWQVLNQ